jgi:hypothetical protein
MKTPEEIKKALECCFYDSAQCGECPYYPVSCDRELVRDAREYIRQLEAENERLLNSYDAALCETSDMHSICKDMEVKAPRWISVEEMMPEHDVFVLVGYKRYDLVFEGCFDEEEKQWYDREYSYIAPPSHWMPLPESPKEETK